MFVSNTNFRVAPLTRNLIKQSAKLLSENFVSQNEFWISLKPSQKEVDKFMLDKVTEMI